MVEGVVAVGSRAAAATKAGIAVDRAGCQGRGAVPGQSRNSCWPRGESSRPGRDAEVAGVATTGLIVGAAVLNATLHTTRNKPHHKKLTMEDTVYCRGPVL